MSLAAVAAALACSSTVALRVLLIGLTIGSLPSKRKMRQRQRQGAEAAAAAAAEAIKIEMEIDKGIKNHR